LAGVALHGIAKRFAGAAELFRGLNLQVAAGEFAVLSGPSGSGKTTLLRLIAGLEKQDRGTIRIGDRVVDDLPPHRRNVAMVFQRPALYPHWAIRRNLAFVGPGRKPTLAVEEAARLLHLEGLLDRLPGQLSGGEQQRVALGRALLRRPAVFLLDEPLSHLDGPIRSALRDELHLLHRRLGATMIYVTHDPSDAWRLADRLFLLDRGELIQAGTPAELRSRPANPWVARFLAGPEELER
jgi:ABC-type sugar transport system ATPase subunit